MICDTLWSLDQTSGNDTYKISPSLDSPKNKRNKKSASLYILRHACMARLFILIAFYTQKKKNYKLLFDIKKKKKEREKKMATINVDNILLYKNHPI